MKFTRKIKRKSKKIYIGGDTPTQCLFLGPLKDEGLGNQLFIYAAGLTIQEKNNIPICMLKDTTNPHSTIDYRTLFNVMKIDNTPSIKKRINLATNIMPAKRNFTNAWNTSSVNTKYSGDIKLQNTLYQNYESIKSIVSKFKDILFNNEFNKAKYKEYKNMITPSTTAYMHVRRGDKVARGHVLTPDYYSNALKNLNDNTNINSVYILSNDMTWCEEHKSEWESSYKRGKLIYFTHDDELVTLYIMMNCQAGAILSSSTFGAWGAILGADMNPSSTIVYVLHPAEYGNKKNPMEFPDRWIGL